MSERRKAAVAVAIIAEPPHGIVFVERGAHLRDHPGQIGLPGGSVDPEDGGDLERTVLRELEEEIGVVPERVRIVGRLREVSQRRNNFDVTAFVAIVQPGPFTIDGSETAGMFTIPLRTVLSKALTDGIVEYSGLTIPSLVLDYENKRVWGLTAQILRVFNEAWQAEASPLRAAVEAALTR
ncbi:MAG TPA: CoA pyrophosphatase [Candidatus Sulfotelmatobacter sp.]|nr:CoA pyrophosphatase [Candidatus Sulfotelmatobacter sp.]